MGALCVSTRAPGDRYPRCVCRMLVRATSSGFGVSRRPGVLDAVPATPGRTAAGSQTPGHSETREIRMNTNSITKERGTIYTLGYTQPKAAATLERLMRNPRSLLVDVRYQPVSHWAQQWNRTSLAGRYGKRYVWERRLGNVHYRDPAHAIELPPGYQA